MEKILILVLLVINAQSVVADCDQVVMDCTMSYNTCAEAAGNSPGDVCTCYGSFIVCVWDGACVSETDHNNMLQNCASSGCSNTECLGIADPPVNVPVDAPVSEPVTFTPVASPACDYAVADECSSRYSSCVGNGTFDEICNCYGPYIYCYFYEANCITLSDYENAVQQCEQFGCTSQQCTSSSSSPIGNTPIEAPFPINAPVSSCNFDNVIPCQDKFINCTSGNYTSTETCDCYGPYLNCVYDTGCITTDDYWNAVRSCEQIGCSLEQCTENSTVTTPVNAPIEVPSSSQCNSQSATVCANEYNTCVNAAGTNINAICSCYGPYFDCLFDIGCLTYSQYQNVVQNCAQSGCSLQQCSGNSTVVAPVTAPIEAPTASTPIGPTPTSTSPVSAPSTVICLQPWELVLIVVGSVLAGVGIAAIIGVIIYLSRGLSGVKKTNKYSKLQRY